MMITISSLPFFSLPFNGFYEPNYNYSLAPVFQGRSVYCYIYLIILMGVCFYLLLCRLRRKTVNIIRCFWVLCWFFCLSVIAVQTIHQARYLNMAQRTIGHMTDDQRYSLIFQYANEVARSFVARVPPGSTGILMTDGDTGVDVDVFALKYIMYPRLDVIRNDKDAEYLVGYLKRDMAASIPDGYKPVVVDVNNPTVLWKRVDDER